jgi:predicted ester cyclase
LPGTGEDVAFDEIVIMTVRDGRVVHQAGVIDNVTGLRQVGAMPAARP